MTQRDGPSSPHWWQNHVIFIALQIAFMSAIVPPPPPPVATTTTIQLNDDNNNQTVSI